MTAALARRRRRHLALPIAVAALAVLSVVPARYLGPAAWFSDLVRVAAAPISHPMRQAAGWLRPAVPHEEAPDQIRFLEQQAEQWQTLYRREQRENRRLRARVEELSRGAAVNTVPVRQLPAPVISAASDLTSSMLTVRAGRSQDVEVNTVVVVGDVQLLGRVERVGPVTSQVRPITDRGGAAIRGRLFVGASPTPDAPSLACLLRPIGDNLLEGDVQDPAELAGQTDVNIDDWLSVGQVIRLDDDAWPANAQMLVLGTIERIEPAPESPLRRVITVRPGVNLSRVSEVVLRITQPRSSFEDEGGAP